MSTSVFCQTTFTVVGIRYATTSTNNVEVISGGTYNGSITIPSTVLYLGVTYKTTQKIPKDQTIQSSFQTEISNYQMS